MGDGWFDDPIDWLVVGVLGFAAYVWLVSLSYGYVG